MRFRRAHHPDDQVAERLLAEAAGPRGQQSPDPVVRLLAAARAPGEPGELTGEDAALAGFRAARAQWPTPVPTRPRRRFTSGALAWTAGIAVTATAGVAVATVSLDRPDPTPAPTRTPAGPAAPATDSPTGPSSGGTDPTPSPSVGPTGTPTSGPPDTGRPTGTGNPADPAALPGLCTAYLAQPAAERDRSLRNPAFRPLVDAAGGPDDVEAYCRTFTQDTAAPTGRPSTPSRPTATGRPDTLPTARPSPTR